MEPVLGASAINPLATHVVDYVALTPCIKVKYGDSFASIGEEFGLSARRVRKYNDMADDYQLTPGETLFLDKKSTWWEGENPMHTVTEGETMHQIAQQYALQLDALYKLNDMVPGASLKIGQKIKLRNPEKMSAFMKAMNQSVNMPDTTINQ
jgi:LysM repeat protein